MSAVPEADDLFPSGEWTGFYQQAGGRFAQDLVLEFAGGVLRGNGGDGIGSFTVLGRYDASTLEVAWTKTYLGAHAVYYRGYRDGKGIWGTWEIAGFARGGFHIWPRRHGAAAAVEQAEVEAPAPQPAGG